VTHKQFHVMSFRGLGALLRIATIYGLGVMLDLDEMSIFLFTLTLISTLPLFVSLEFHVPSVRRARRLAVQGNERIYRTALAANLIVPAVGTLAAIAPIFFFVGKSEFSLSSAQIAICIAIIFTDAVIQETQRILAIKEEQTIVSIIFLSKQIQVLISVTVAFISHYLANLTFLNVFIASYLALSFIITMWLCRARYDQLFQFSGSQFRANDVATWLKRNAKQSLVFFVSGIFGKLTFGYERIIIAILFSKELFAQYTFAILIIGGIGSFIEPVVNQFVYPGLIRDFVEKNHRVIWKSLIRAAIVLCIFSCFSITAILISQFVLKLEILQLSHKELSAFLCLLILLYANILIQPFLLAGNLDAKIRNTNIIVFVIMYGGIFSQEPTLVGLLTSMIVANLVGFSARFYHVSRMINLRNV